MRSQLSFGQRFRMERSKKIADFVRQFREKVSTPGFKGKIRDVTELCDRVSRLCDKWLYVTVFHNSARDLPSRVLLRSKDSLIIISILENNLALFRETYDAAARANNQKLLLSMGPIRWLEAATVCDAMPIALYILSKYGTSMLEQSEFLIPYAISTGNEALTSSLIAMSVARGVNNFKHLDMFASGNERLVERANKMVASYSLDSEREKEKAKEEEGVELLFNASYSI